MFVVCPYRLFLHRVTSHMQHVLHIYYNLILLLEMRQVVVQIIVKY